MEVTACIDHAAICPSVLQGTSKRDRIVPCASLGWSAEAGVPQMADTSTLQLLCVSDLVVGYNNSPVASVDRFSLQAGEIVSLSSPSGSGKTTLLRTLALLQDPVSGSITFENRSPEAVGVPRYRASVMLVPQQPVMHLEEQPVEDNLVYPFGFSVHRQAGRVYDRNKAIRLFDMMDVPLGLLSQPARELSVGQRQRICLVRSLLLEPKVLLLDEPTSALDDERARLVLALLREVATNTGIAVLLVSHQTERSALIHDRTIKLRMFSSEECDKPTQVETKEVKQ